MDDIQLNILFTGLVFEVSIFLLKEVYPSPTTHTKWSLWESSLGLPKKYAFQLKEVNNFNTVYLSLKMYNTKQNENLLMYIITENRDIKNSPNYSKIAHMPDIISFRTQLGKNDGTTGKSTLK